jgi:hypothetical protein
MLQASPSGHQRILLGYVIVEVQHSSGSGAYVTYSPVLESDLHKSLALWTETLKQHAGVLN